MKHTPTPWTYHIDYILDANNELVATGCKIKPQEESENNKLIVTAVNNHEKLVSILQECVSNFERNRTGGCNGIWNTPEENSPYDKAKKLLTTLNP